MNILRAANTELPLPDPDLSVFDLFTGLDTIPRDRVWISLKGPCFLEGQFQSTHLESGRCTAPTMEYWLPLWPASPRSATMPEYRRVAPVVRTHNVTHIVSLFYRASFSSLQVSGLLYY
jgi:hypothetical protein